MKALGALVVVMLAGLVMGARLFRESADLKSELAALRAATSPTEVPANPPSAGVTAILADIEAESALLRAAEAKAVEIGKSLPPMSDQEWRSLGRVEELGQQAADFLQTFARTIGKMKADQQIAGEDTAGFMNQMMAWMKRMEAIGEMEDDPAEIAKLHTATLASRSKLDAATQDRLRAQIAHEFTLLRDQNLTRPQRPDTGRDDWYARRRTALNEAAQRTDALIPEALRVEFAVAQSFQLGTGMITKTKVEPDGHGSVSMTFDLPGIDWHF